MANEKRLIAYDPIAFGEFTQSLRNTLEVYDPYSDGYEDGMGRIEDWLEYNYVDAVEVVHARWVMTLYTTTSKRGRVIANKKFACSVCGYSNGRKQSNYCPNCGAKMDGGNEDV